MKASDLTKLERAVSFDIPADVRNYAQDHMLKEWLIYRANAWRDSITGIKEPCVSAECTACGNTMYLDKVVSGCHGFHQMGFRVWEGGGFTDYTTGDKLFCPECGAPVQALHISSVSSYYSQFMWITKAARIPATVLGTEKDLFAMIEYRAEKFPTKDTGSGMHIHPWECQIVLPGRQMVRMAAYTNVNFSAVITYQWHARRRWQECMQQTDQFLSFDREASDGTTAENSGVEEYMRKCPSNFPAAFLKLWQHHKNIEVLARHGGASILGSLIEEEKRIGCQSRSRWNLSVPQLKEINWKMKRPSEMLGLNKQELGELENADAWTWRAFKTYRACGIPFDRKNWETMTKDSNEWEKKSLLNIAENGHSPDHAMRYVKKQDEARPEQERLRRRITLNDLMDYWRMAKEAGQPFETWPQNLLRAHDELAVQKKAKENAAELPFFEKRAKKLARYCCTIGPLMIQPPTCRADFVREGTLLHHCVSTYADKHKDGRTNILFIRKVEEPTEPYYTLELDEKELTVIQNRGKFNCERSEEVREFEDTWLAWLRSGAKKTKNGEPVLPKERVTA